MKIKIKFIRNITTNKIKMQSKISKKINFIRNENKNKIYKKYYYK